MKSTLILAILGGIVLVLIFFSARVALRWIVRLLVVGFILLLAIGGVTWWWLAGSTSPQDRPANTRSTNSNRR